MENLRLTPLPSECLNDRLIYEKYCNKVKSRIIGPNAVIHLTNGMYITMLHWAVLMSDVEFVDYLLLNKVLTEIQADCFHGTALLAAVHYGNFEIVKKLINGGANLNAINVYDKEIRGRTPLYTAVQNNDIRIAELLIDSEATHYSGVDSIFYYSVLAKAIYNQNEAMVKLMLKKYEVKIEFENDMHMHIIQAIKTRNHRIAKIFMSYYARSGTYTRYNVLINIILEKNFELLNYFLMHYELEINTLTERSNFPFYISIESDINETITEFLLDDGIDVNSEDIIPHNLLVEHGLQERIRVIPTIERHIVKLIACNYHVCDKNLKAVSGKEFDNLREQCKEEIKLLKTTLFANTNLNFYSILHKPLRQLALGITHVKTHEIFEVKSSIKFPLYRGMIFNRLEKAIAKKKLIINAESFFFNIFSSELPYVFIIRKISSYLSDTDLAKLCEEE